MTRYARERLLELGDPEKAQQMAAYMKTSMPFFGVQSGDRKLIARELRKQFPIEDRDSYEASVRDLWRRKHREEKYLAVAVARSARSFIDVESLPLYEQMIREGAWWDFVDEIAVRLVGKVLLDYPDDTWPLMKRWIDDDDMWIRRTAILCQNKHKESTDPRILFRFCLRRADETEFFIRKAIGWALREYSYTAPDQVREFLEQNRERLSGLSFREGAKVLRREGLMP